MTKGVTNVIGAKNKAGQADWFYPVILSSLIARPSDEDYKTLCRIFVCKINDIF